MHRALILTGVAGVGKSTVADAIGGVLSTAGSVTAVVDADTLAQFGPPTQYGEHEGIGFYDHMKCVNLASLWTNFQAAGARFVVVSAGIESAPVRERYLASLAGCAVQVVRLVAATQAVRQRLRHRDSGPKLDRHLRTLAEQEARLDAAALEDFTVTNDRPAIVVARDVITRARWMPPTE